MKCERPFFNAKKHGLNRLQFTMCGRMIHTMSPVIICLKNIIQLHYCQECFVKLINKFEAFKLSCLQTVYGVKFILY